MGQTYALSLSIYHLAEDSMAVGRKTPAGPTHYLLEMPGLLKWAQFQFLSQKAWVPSTYVNRLPLLVAQTCLNLPYTQGGTSYISHLTVLSRINTTNIDFNKIHILLFWFHCCVTNYPQTL